MIQNTHHRFGARLDFILEQLQRLYPKPQAGLDFENDPFQILIATLLSARCRDSRVNEVAPLLFKEAKTPESMAKLSADFVRTIIRPCGLSDTKSRNIVNLSKILVERFKGTVPDNFEDLEALPGVGHKTASVVLGHAFHKEAFPVDTHIFRLSRRWKLSDGNTPLAVEKDLKKLFPEALWYKLHLQMITYGREHCNRYLCNEKHYCIICKGLEAI